MLAGSKPAASWLDVFPGTSVAVLEAHAMDYIHADAVTSMMGRRQKSLQDSLRTLEVNRWGTINGRDGARTRKRKSLANCLKAECRNRLKRRLFRRSIDLERIFFRTVRRSRQHRLLGSKNGLAALFLLARFDCIEALAKPGFFRPAPVAVDVCVVVSTLGSHSINEQEQAAYQS
jgi:hypothetical protein